jgi:hypothetical protein
MAGDVRRVDVEQPVQDRVEGVKCGGLALSEKRIAVAGERVPQRELPRVQTVCKKRLLWEEVRVSIAPDEAASWIPVSAENSRTTGSF